ncbi:uncharacterized protein BX664DRAFT_323971 [Halteromyces radiatus]|uniref:uncharacterized protein n=1 Tax=Halteromyces radiatus TaxID=101107 RepID=UPI0022202F98|nr:uncharacterized protein BX664DRAFT_323971 [Halteromyces radiatus]KAI8096426.1 hypothetical protein BX664DRAFT_323971 [Halteromyces radiatus]
MFPPTSFAMKPIEIPCMNTIKQDDLFSLWQVFSKNKSNLENTKRLENFSWRLWYHESLQHQIPIPVTSNNSSLSSHSTLGPQTPLPVKEEQKRISKFYLDDSEDDLDDDDLDDEELWSTVSTKDDYLEQAYQHDFDPPTPKKEMTPDNHLFSSTHVQKKPTYCSLLSRLFQSSSIKDNNNNNNNNNNHVKTDLPPQLQSCVDWERSQNRIPYRLGYSLPLPDEKNIIW